MASNNANRTESILAKFSTRLRKLVPNFRSHANSQMGLILVATIPCALLGLVSLYFAGASGYLFCFFLILIILLISFAAVRARQKAEYQLFTLSNLVEAMIEGDYSLRGREQSSPAFQGLLNLINQLAENLEQHKIRAEESRLLLEKIIDQMEAMLIATDAEGQIAIVNRSAVKQLKLTNRSLENLSLDDVGLSELKSKGNSEIIRISDSLVDGEYILFKDRFISDNKPHQLFLLSQADNLLREKERQAWQSILRVLNHELNNSLTPIATFSRTLLRKLEKENSVSNIEQLKSALTVIKERAESLDSFVKSYSQLSHLPMPNIKAYDWLTSFKNIERLFLDCTFNYEVKDDVPTFIGVDPQQIEQVIINLVKNAQESMNGKAEKPIGISVNTKESKLQIIVSDCGTGIDNQDNIFVPFYSTKANGSGIGLVLCQQIIHNHGGRIYLKNRDSGLGAEVFIVLPLNQSE